MNSYIGANDALIAGAETAAVMLFRARTPAAE